MKFAVKEARITNANLRTGILITGCMACGGDSIICMKVAIAKRNLQFQISRLIFSVILTCNNLILFQCNVLFLKLFSMHLSV